MSDLINYAVTRLGNSSLVVPHWSITGQIVDSNNHAIVIDDISAGNVKFPDLLGTLTTQQQDEWVNKVVLELIYQHFGL